MYFYCLFINSYVGNIQCKQFSYDKYVYTKMFSSLDFCFNRAVHPVYNLNSVLILEYDLNSRPKKGVFCKGNLFPMFTAYL